MEKIKLYASNSSQITLLAVTLYMSLITYTQTACTHLNGNALSWHYKAPVKEENVKAKCGEQGRAESCGNSASVNKRHLHDIPISSPMKE